MNPLFHAFHDELEKISAAPGSQIFRRGLLPTGRMSPGKKGLRKGRSMVQASNKSLNTVGINPNTVWDRPRSARDSAAVFRRAGVMEKISYNRRSSSAFNTQHVRVSKPVFDKSNEEINRELSHMDRWRKLRNAAAAVGGAAVGGVAGHGSKYGKRGAALGALAGGLGGVALRELDELGRRVDLKSELNARKRGKEKVALSLALRRRAASKALEAADDAAWAAGELQGKGPRREALGVVRRRLDQAMTFTGGKKKEIRRAGDDVDFNSKKRVTNALGYLKKKKIQRAPASVSSARRASYAEFS